MTPTTTATAAESRMEAARARRQHRLDEELRQAEESQSALESTLRQGILTSLQGDHLLAESVKAGRVESVNGVGTILAFHLDLPVLAGEVHRVPVGVRVDQTEEKDTVLCVHLLAVDLPPHRSTSCRMSDWCDPTPDGFWDVLTKLVDDLVMTCADANLHLPESWDLVTTL